MQCTALIRCPSGVHQAPFLRCVPGRWCELEHMPADGAIDSHFVYDGDLEGLLLSCVAGLST
jgi:hypothetical protein